MKKSEKLYLSASELSTMLGISLGTAYRIIRKLNEELAQKGYIVISGKLPRRYFEERYYGGSGERA